MDRLAEMLEMQRNLQRKSFIGQDPGTLPIEWKITFFKDMVLGIEREIGEALDEIKWKPWTIGPPVINADGVKKELVDAFHFFMNLMLTVGMTADELHEMYIKKHQVNVDRMASGTYDGKTTKCTGCKRALEDVSLTVVNEPNSSKIEAIFCQCGEKLQLAVVAPFITD